MSSSNRGKNRSRSRKRNKSSPLVENSPKKTKSYKSPHQLQPEPKPEVNHCTGSATELKDISDTEESLNLGSQTILHSPDISSTPINSSRIEMESPSPSQTQSLLGGLGGLVQHESYSSQSHNQHTDFHGTTQPQFLNPVMVPPPMNPAMLAYQGLPQGVMPPAPCLSDQDIVKIAVVIKQLVTDDIKQLVSAKVESATQSLKTEPENVKDRCTNLEKQVNDLKAKNDDIEQYSRRMCLRIAGLKENENENVIQRVLDLADNLNVNINADDIDRVHRVGRMTDSGGEADEDEQGVSAVPNRSREIIIKFTNSSARLRLLQGRTKLREKNISNIFINEDLTPARKALAYECRKLKRTKTSKVSKTWIYAGYPHILDKSGNKVKITCLSDLDDYREKQPEPSQSVTSS